MCVSMIAFALASALSLTASGQEVRTDAPARLARLIEVAAIDEACALLEPGQRAVLDREILTARHQAEREGLTTATYRAGSERIQRRWSTPDCESQDTRHPVMRYQQALDGWLLGGERRFDGPRRIWTAGRAEEGTSDWILAQDAAHGDLSARFGSARIGDRAVVLLSLRSARRPASAVLILRDIALAPRPFDFTSGGRREPPGGEPLAALGALASGQQRIWTSGVLRDGGRFAPEGEGGTASFTFPDDTLERLMALDAAEGARVDFYDSAGARMGRIWIEIGALRQARDYALAANPAQ